MMRIAQAVRYELNQLPVVSLEQMLPRATQRYEGRK